MSKKKEVTVVNTEVAEVKNQFSNAGLEGLTDDVEVIMPVAKLMQAMSPELDDEDLELKKGQIVHSLLLEAMPETFIPIMFFDTKILLTPRNDDEKAALKESLNLTDEDLESILLCRAADGRHGDRPSNGQHFGTCKDCGLFKWQGNKKPVCMHTINVLALFEGHTIPTVIRFSNTSFKQGKRLLSLARMRADIKEGKYKLTSASAEGNGNKWFEFRVKPAGVASEAEFEQAVKIYDAYNSKVLIIEDEEDLAQDQAGDEY